MIITKKDIYEFEDAYHKFSSEDERLEELYEQHRKEHDRVTAHLHQHYIKDGNLDPVYVEKCWQDMAPNAQSINQNTDKNYKLFLNWLTNNPQVLMAGAGFHEFVGAHKSRLYSSLVGVIGGFTGPRPAFRNFTGLWLLPSLIPNDSEVTWDAYCLDTVKSIEHEEIDDDKLDDCIVELPNFSSIMAEAKRFIDNPVIDSTILMSPKMWTPQKQEEEKNRISTPATELILAMQKEKIDLSSLNWRQFEEVVAESLRRSGMEIHMVRESPQGGRDIVARGELIPGMEPITVAIEVKHRNFVDRPEVQKAIHQNRMFPALLFVTSGRFSAGVLRESQLRENRLRLFLKDGMAVRELLKRFPFG